jgi:acid phosphatase (class A)
MIARNLRLSLALSVSCLLLASQGASAQGEKFNFLKPNQVDLLRLVPPPPPANSQAEKEDMAGVLEVQKNRTPERSKRALADNVLSIWVYADVMGPKFKAENLPVMTAFFTTMHADARILLMQTKDAFERKRPHLVNSEVKPLDPKLRLALGYPSGGVMNSTLTAIMLAAMVPEKSFELFERAREYGDNRVVVGVHYPRDVFGGHIAATAAAQAFFDTPFFMEEFKGAQEELRRVLGYGALPVAQKPEDTRTGSVKAK